jgi:hypothetical protein
MCTAMQSLLWWYSWLWVLRTRVRQREAGFCRLSSLLAVGVGCESGGLVVACQHCCAA